MVTRGPGLHIRQIDVGEDLWEMDANSDRYWPRCMAIKTLAWFACGHPRFYRWRWI